MSRELYLLAVFIVNLIFPIQQPVPNTENLVKVTRVIDGDTIEIESGQKVRLIGVNAPESVDPKRKDQCFGKESSDFTKSLLLEKSVKLEKDVSETDKYGRLLRYVWLDSQMVNVTLVKEGFAQVSTFPPDVKYKDKFLVAQNYAKENNLGLWSKCKSSTVTMLDK